MARARRAWDCRANSPWVNGSMLSSRWCSLLGHLGGDPYWDSFSVALLTNQYNGKGQKGLGLQGQKPLHQCVTAILAELFITEPSWWWSLLGFFLLSRCFLTSMMARVRRACDRRATSPWVSAILAVLFITGPSWRWPLLGFFLL